MTQAINEHLEVAKAAGFDAAAKRAGDDFELGTKLQRAQSSFQSITQVQIDKFNQDLRKKTEETDKKTGRMSWKELAFVAVERYPNLPPLEVMQQVKTAREMDIFEKFEVSYIETRDRVRDKDPIVFGLVKGSTDRFFIAQWGDDVKISDLLGIK